MLPWAELLRRVFAVDVPVCAKCLGAMSVIAYLTDAVVVAKILAHLGLPSSPPPISPARTDGDVRRREVGRAMPAPARGPPSRHGHAASDIDDSTDATGIDEVENAHDRER